MTKNKLAIIGGSGLYDIEGMQNPKWKSISTPWGKPSDQILNLKYKGKEVCFLPRHARGHKISPSNINFRANIDALKQLGVTDIVSVSAVGSLKEDLPPGKFVIVDQFIDRTFARKKTFFDEDCISHVSMSSPVCENLRKISVSNLKKLKLNFHSNGTYICIEGPQFSSLAESNLFRSWGCDIIGMTNMPEAKLAREAGICYAAVSMVTDFDCWHPKHDSVTVDQIIRTMNQNSNNAFKLIEEFSKIEKISCDEKIKNISKNSLITSKDKIEESTKKKLKFILNDL